jgi:hypothetical protein
MLSRVKLSQEATAKVASTAATAAANITLKKHIRLRSRCRMSGLSMLAEAKGATYKPNAPEVAIEKRSISGGIIHGSFPIEGLESCHQFWAERRQFQVPRFRQRLMSASDRLAQTLITITRPQPRVQALPEVAFRTMAMFLKILTIVQVAETKSILMAGQMGMNAEGVVGQAIGESNKKNNINEEKKEGTLTPTPEGKSEEKK